MEIFLALGIVLCALTVIALTMIGMRQELRAIELDEPTTIDLAPAVEVPASIVIRKMAVPKKRPLVQTRHSTTL